MKEDAKEDIVDYLIRMHREMKVFLCAKDYNGFKQYVKKVDLNIYGKSGRVNILKTICLIAKGISDLDFFMKPIIEAHNFERSLLK